MIHLTAISIIAVMKEDMGGVYFLTLKIVVGKLEEMNIVIMKRSWEVGAYFILF